MNMFKPTSATTPQEYINALEDPRKSDIKRIHDRIRKVAPKLKPYIQHGMIGYGKVPYESKSGRKGDWCILGLASQKNYISIYSCVLVDGQYLAESYKDKLGRASVGKSCIRYKHIEDIPWDVLDEVFVKSQKIGLEKGIFT